ncbi:MAG: hypothetical protein GY749_35990 [Desulfobacteraceae bacterium]|nr:hypothetical protein [Desulfobacteraceae bacterium]
MDTIQSLTQLRDQLTEAAGNFAGDDRKLDTILTEMVNDIQKAAAEPMEIFPVCHHSPASGLFMVRRLLEKRPKVIFVELCEDLLPLITELSECKLPVALQAFASELRGFDPSWAPLSVVAPITEFSAEYQAISYALAKETEIVFVDRSVDHIFQWIQKKEAKPDNVADDGLNTEEKEERGMHGSAVGIQVGELRPRFHEFEDILLRNAKVKHYSEWWNQYVEQPLIGAPYSAYRHVMFLIGSLFRRLGSQDDARLDEDRKRESYMWTRMKEYLKTHKNIKAEECIYICGAFHSASNVPEFGIQNDSKAKIPKATGTKWLYGLIPSSFSAIEYQFGLPWGSAAIASATWKKSLQKIKIKPFKVGQKINFPKKSLAEADVSLSDFLLSLPEKRDADTEQLLGWCVNITSLARKNGYLASTADSIAIFQTSVLLARMRNRFHPSPYDFQDAAITCLEKEMVPRKRDIRRLCEIMLGGNRIGMVGYHSLPPLARDVYDRLKPLNINPEKRTIQRALLDFQANPELLPCSDLLWKLRYLLDDYAIRPIMGQRKLGFTPQQESWDIAIGRYQRSIIELGYEGVTVEQVLEYRLRSKVYSGNANAGIALEAVEDSILFLKSSRLSDEIGRQAVILMNREESAVSAPDIYRRIRVLLQYYRNLGEFPEWLTDFVSQGFSRYCTLLPEAFSDSETSPAQISSMLGFIVTLENLALSLGCSRDQFIIAIKHSLPSDHAKTSLLWTAEYLLDLRTLSSMRIHFDNVLDNNMLLPSFPESISGFIAALDFSQSIASFTVELLSKAFERLPDKILLPWLPKLIMKLKSNRPELMSRLVSEAAAVFPDNIGSLDKWIPLWEKQVAETLVQTSAQEQPSPDLTTGLKILFSHKETCNAMAGLLDMPRSWQQTADLKTCPILSYYPDTLNAMAGLLGFGMTAVKTCPICCNSRIL